jgi:Putative peptidoglycan binding domain
MGKKLRGPAVGALLSVAVALGGVSLAAGPAAAATTYSCDGHTYYTGTAITEEGNTGDRVIQAQCDLKSAGYLGSSQIDGIFGPQTLAAVKGYQTMYHDECNSGLAIDGIVGPQTWAALRSACPN